MTDSYDIYHHHYHYYHYHHHHHHYHHHHHHHHQNHHEIYHHHHYHDDDDIFPIYSIDITYLLTCSCIIVSLRVTIIGATIVRLSIIKKKPCLYIIFMHSDKNNEHNCENENDDSDDDEEAEED